MTFFYKKGCFWGCFLPPPHREILRKKCETCAKTVAALPRTAVVKASRIIKLEKQLTRYVEDFDESQSKKRKRDDQTIFDAAMIADSSDTDIKVRSITEENTTLKTQLQTDAEKPIVEDKSTEVKHQVLPIPNASTLIQQIAKRFVKMQDKKTLPIII